jgi:hypothetical protein
MNINFSIELNLIVLSYFTKHLKRKKSVIVDLIKNKWE